MSSFTYVFGDLLEQLKDPNLLLLIGLLFILAVANLGGEKKSQLTRATLANNRVKLRTVKTAIEQLKSNHINEICLFSGSFRRWQLDWFMPFCKIWLTGYPPSLFIPNANQSMEVVGRPNCGKTFSVIDRVLGSAIAQNYPIFLYDYKGGPHGLGGQIPFVGASAVRRGYKLRIFAPGRDYSCVINPLDFITDDEDMTTAETLAKNFHANLRGDTGKTDGFFGPAGKRVLFASFLLAKNTIYPDLAMAFCLLQLPDFAKRLKYAATQNLKYFSKWVQIGFKQIISVAEAEETSSGILAGAQDIITTFMQHDLLASFLGETNTSLILERKEILIFQSDISRQQVVNPLLAATIETLINQNFAFQREVPLICSFDELTTIKIENLPTYANEHRSKGYVGIYGYQSIEQLEDSYGKGRASILRSPLGTRFWFNPGNLQTARDFSAYIGDKEVVVKNKTTSRNLGSIGGQRSINEQTQLTPILKSDDFTSFRKGECVYINSASESETRGDIPWHLRRIKIPRRDKKDETKCKKLWSEQIIRNLTNREIASRKNRDLDSEIEKREALAEKLFPLPPKSESNSASVHNDKEREKAEEFRSFM